MEIEERLEIIRNKLETLRTRDTEFATFGSNEPWAGHQYILNPCATEEDVAEFEGASAVVLPPEYRLYLTKIADGGAGPFYGLYSLGQAVDALVEHFSTEQEYFEDYFRPFPFHTDEVWNQIRAVESWETDDPLNFDFPDDLPGMVYLCEYGCGGYYVLIVSGEQYGTVWYYHSDGYGFPCYKHEQPFGFFDFMEWWLDESLQALDGPRPEPEYDPEKEKVLIYDQNGMTEIPEIVYQCGNLRKLQFSRNKLAEIPDRLFDMLELRFLDLNMNGLTAVPEGIGRMATLKKLNLAYNYEIDRLPAGIGDLAMLEELDLAYNSKLAVLPEEIGKLSRLTKLSLFACAMTELPETIGDLQSLKSLNLGNTKIKRLPESIRKLQALESLVLEYTDQVDLADLFDKLGDLPHFSYLSVGMAYPFPENIGKLTHLQTLRLLANYGLEKDAHFKLPESLSRLPLRELKLEWQALLPDSIAEMQTLEELELSKVALQRSEGELAKLKNLKRLFCNMALTEEEKAALRERLPGVVIF